MLLNTANKILLHTLVANDNRKKMLNRDIYDTMIYRLMSLSIFSVHKEDH